MAGWLRLAIPSVADSFFVAVVAAILLTPLAVRLLGDAGIGWHIRTGQLILQTHAVPRVDPFSSTMGGRPWFAWEWLYDLVVGELEATAGLAGVVWFSTVVIAAAFAGVLHWLIRRGVNLFTALILVLLAFSASMIHLLGRPHVVSWLFTVAWFAILNRRERDGMRGRRWLWVLPLLLLVWVNVHGGFLVGFALLFLFWLGALWDYARASADRIEDVLGKIEARRRVLGLTWVGLLTAVASLINPYGWKLHAHIASYLSNRYLMDHIQEFQSPDFHGVAQRCFVLLVLITLATLALRGRSVGMSRFLVVLFAVYAGLYASRNLPVSSLLLVMAIGPEIGRSSGAGFSHRMAALQLQLRGHLWPAAAIVLTLVLAAQGGQDGLQSAIHADFDATRMPVKAVDYLEKQALTAPVLTPDSWGGYVIYRRYPRQRVVIDDRHDLYGEDFIRPYLKTMHGERGWPDFLFDHAVRCVLVPRDSALASLLRQTTAWKAVYEDDVAVVFLPSR